MKIIITLLAAALLTGGCVLLLGVKVFFVKGGRFPSGHAHDSEALRRKGVGCHRRPDEH